MRGKICFLLAVLTMALSGCVIPPDVSVASKQREVGEWSWSFANARLKPVVNPDPIDGDSCLNCGGDGILGDGSTVKKCPVCDGTGKIRRDVDDGEEPDGEIDLDLSGLWPSPDKPPLCVGGDCEVPLLPLPTNGENQYRRRGLFRWRR